MNHILLVKCKNCSNTINHFESKRKRKWTKKRDDKPCIGCGLSVWESHIFWLQEMGKTGLEDDIMG